MAATIEFQAEVMVLIFSINWHLSYFLWSKTIFNFAIHIHWQIFNGWNIFTWNTDEAVIILFLFFYVLCIRMVMLYFVEGRSMVVGGHYDIAKSYFVSVCLPFQLLTLLEKCPNTEFFLVRIFPHSDGIRRENTVQKKIRILTLFTRCNLKNSGIKFSWWYQW